jgi:hypothetical protein
LIKLLRESLSSIVIVGEAVVEKIKGLVSQFVSAEVFRDVFPAAGSWEIDGIKRQRTG